MGEEGGCDLELSWKGSGGYLGSKRWFNAVCSSSAAIEERVSLGLPPVLDDMVHVSGPVPPLSILLLMVEK